MNLVVLVPSLVKHCWVAGLDLPSPTPPSPEENISETPRAPSIPKPWQTRRAKLSGTAFVVSESSKSRQTPWKNTCLFIIPIAGGHHWRRVIQGTNGIQPIQIWPKRMSVGGSRCEWMKRGWLVCIGWCLQAGVERGPASRGEKGSLNHR